MNEELGAIIEEQTKEYLLWNQQNKKEGIGVLNAWDRLVIAFRQNSMVNTKIYMDSYLILSRAGLSSPFEEAHGGIDQYNKFYGYE